MDEYTRLLGKIESYYKKEDIISNDEVISAYDLYVMINDKFRDLRTINFDSELEKKIEADDNIIKRIKRVMGKCESILDKRVDSIILKHQGVSKITFGFVSRAYSIFPDYKSVCDTGEGKKIKREYACPYIPEYISVCKKENDDKWFFDCAYDLDKKTLSQFKEFVSKYYSEIESIFMILEYYYCELNISKKEEERNLMISDSFINTKLSYDGYGRVNIKLYVDSNEDPNNISNKEWLSRKSLKDILNNNIAMFLKKIPVKVSDLQYVYKTIVEEELVKQNYNKLVKKK